MISFTGQTVKEKLPQGNLGDWHLEKQGGKSHVSVKVQDQRNPDVNFLVLLHELVEGYLCMQNGVTEKEVEKFDEENPKAKQPGDLKDSPYQTYHKIADQVEKLVSKELQVDFEDY